MEQQKRLILLPDRAYARTQMIYNALWFALFVVTMVAVIIVLKFPKFFLVELPQYKKVLFQDGSAGNVFFARLVWSFILLFFAAAISRFVAIYATLSKKEISVALDESGIVSRYGFFQHRVGWDNFRDVRVTDFPLRFRFNKRGSLLAHSTFNRDTLRKKIIEFKKTL